jgi:hypothetical protein
MGEGARLVLPGSRGPAGAVPLNAAAAVLSLRPLVEDAQWRRVRKVDRALDLVQEGFREGGSAEAAAIVEEVRDELRRAMVIYVGSTRPVESPALGRAVEGARRRRARSAPGR